MTAPEDPRRLLGLRTALEDAGWDALLDSAGNTDPFRRLDVLLLMASREERPVVVVARRGGDVVSAAPLALTSRRGLRVLRTAGPSSGWFDAEPPVLDDDAAERLLRACRAQKADILRLREIRADSPLIAAMRRAGPEPRLDEEYPTYRVTPGDLRVTARKRRAECRRLVRVFERDNHPLIIDLMHDWDAMQPSYAECREMHRARWSGAPDAHDLVVSEWGRRVTDEGLAILGREGLVHLTTLRSQGDLLAFALAVRCGDGAVAYRMAFDRDRPGVSGLGAAAFLASLDALVAEGVTSIDLGSGGDVFKRSFTAPVPVVTAQWPLSRRGAAYLRLARLADARRARAQRRGAAP